MEHITINKKNYNNNYKYNKKKNNLNQEEKENEIELINDKNSIVKKARPATETDSKKSAVLFL